MRFVIIAAMQDELDYLIKNIPLVNRKVIKSYNYEYIVGDYDIERKIEVIIGISGVGRVASSLLIANLLHTFKLDNNDYIVNIGTAGGIGNLHVSDLVVGIGTLYGDVNLNVFASKYRYGQMSHCPLEFKGNEYLIKLLKKSDFRLKYGQICTNESFMTNYDECKKLIDDHFSDFNILAFDMESAAYAQSCYLLNLNFLSLRYISDMIGMENQDQVFEQSVYASSVIALNICIYLLNNL